MPKSLPNYEHGNGKEREKRKAVGAMTNERID